MAYRIVSAGVAGLLLLSVSACTITVQSGPSSPATQGYAPAPAPVYAAPANTVYVPVAVAPPARTPAHPVVVTRPQPPTPTPAPARQPSLPSPPITHAPTAPPGFAIVPAATAPTAAATTTPPAATTTPPPVTSPREPVRKPGDPRAIKKPQSPPSVK